jgi:hypothetical protein
LLPLPDAALAAAQIGRRIARGRKLGGELPLRRYEAGVQALQAERGNLPAPRDERAFLVDFFARPSA